MNKKAIHLHMTTPLTPEQYIAGLTDFGLGCSKLFGNSAEEYLKVHRRGLLEADVTESSGGFWERLRYDWSNPTYVVLTTTDSNVWAGSSGHTCNFTRQPNGTTDIDLVVVREGNNLKGRMSVLNAYLAATVNAAAVAKHHGVKAFTNMSQMTVSQMSIAETTPSPQHKLHWLAEQALNWSGLPVAHVA